MKNLSTYNIITILLLSVAFVQCDSAHTQSIPSPNIVLILADDLGYGDVQAYHKQSKIATPAMNRLANEGLQFTDAHTPSSVCTPTRYGLLSGRYAWRSRLKKGVLSGYSPTLIEEGRQTIGSVLQKAGYHTSVIGKWHLGLDWAWKGNIPKGANGLNYVPPKGAINYNKAVSLGPNDAGFDYSYIIPGSLDMGPYVYLENGKATQLPDQSFAGESFPAFIRKGEVAKDFSHVDALDHITNKATDYIKSRANQKQAFFLYFPLTSPHKPALPHPRFEGKSGLGPHADFIMQTDWTVGQILQALDDAQISDNTIVIMTSDNGSYMFELDNDQKDHTEDASIQGYRPDHHQANGDWRGTKADIYEAGHRVPFLMRWPAQWESNRKIEQTICLTDILATLADLANVKIDPKQSEDSFSFKALLDNETENFSRPPIVHHSVNGTFAIRDQNYKMIFSEGSGGREKPVGKVFQKPYQLYNLEEDPQEEVNLIDQKSEMPFKLEQELEKIRSKSHTP